MSKVLLIGEPILDIMNPVHPPEGQRLLGCSEPQIYALSSEPILSVGGVFYWARFLKPFFEDKEIRVVFPKPNDTSHIAEFEKQIETIDKRAISWDRGIYTIQRFVEMEDLSVKPPPEFIDSKFRADRGHSHRAEKPEIDEIAKKLKEAYNNWLIQGGNTRKFVVLADYDLGLFTRGFLKKINEIVDKRVDILVYARRQWRKYAEYFNNDNCTIVADLEYTLAELSDIEKLHDDDDLRKNPFRCIKSRFPHLKQFVLVDRKETRFACWNKTNKIWKLPANHSSLFTPIGYRAIVGACLCLQDHWHDISNFLKFAHEAAKYSGHVLLNKFSSEEASKIKTIKLETLQSDPIELHPSESFQCHLCQNKLVLDLKEADTGIEGILTASDSIQKHIKDILKIIENKETNRASLSLYKESTIEPKQGIFKKIIKQNSLPQPEKNGHIPYLLQKILFWGHTGSGKTHLAKKIAEHLKMKCSVIQCNDLTKNIFNEIIIGLNDPTLGILILDEVGNMNKGADIQKSLLHVFGDLPEKIKTLPDKQKIIFFTCSLTEEEMKNSTDKNVKDFYDRLQCRFEIPALSDRPYDAAYFLAQKLFDKGVRQVSLLGLMTIVENKFDSMRNLKAFIDKAVVPSGKIQLEDDWFTQLYEKEKDFKIASDTFEARLIDLK